jgi:hypothetical protein
LALRMFMVLVRKISGQKDLGTIEYCTNRRVNVEFCWNRINSLK